MSSSTNTDKPRVGNNKNNSKIKGIDIFYDNTVSALSSNNVQDAIDEVNNGASSGPVAAEDVTYDNSTSGMSATDVQAAIDELENTVDGLGGGGSGATELKRVVLYDENSHGSGTDKAWGSLTNTSNSTFYETDTSVMEFGPKGDEGGRVVLKIKETGTYLMEIPTGSSQSRDFLEVRDAKNGFGNVIKAKDTLLGASGARHFEGTFTVSSAPIDCYFYNTHGSNIEFDFCIITKISNST